MLVVVVPPTRSMRHAGTLDATNELLTEFEEAVQRFERDETDRAGASKRRRLAQTDPTVNVAADLDNDAYAGHGVLHQSGRENAQTGRAGA